MLKSSYLLIFKIFLCLLIAGNLAGRLDFDDEFDDEENYHLLKRFLFHKPTTSNAQKSQKVLENLIKPESFHSDEKSFSLMGKPAGSLSGPCHENPCENNGICIPKGSTSFECRCVGPWRGIYCGIEDACYQSPCQNGGTCFSVHDDYWCKCTSEYHGNECQTKYKTPNVSDTLCQSDICNGGRCIPLETTYRCQCPDDRIGEHCERRFKKRLISNMDGYYNLWHKLKRAMIKPDKSSSRNIDPDDDVAIYDVKNGIYF